MNSVLHSIWTQYLIAMRLKRAEKWWTLMYERTLPARIFCSASKGNPFDWVMNCQKTQSTKQSMTFSNSLILHQIKTKKITTVEEVWIPSLIISMLDFDDFTSLFTPQVLFRLRRYITLETVFHRLSKHLELHQYSAACHIFNSLLSVWISQWNNVSVSCLIYCIKNTTDKPEIFKM